MQYRSPIVRFHMIPARLLATAFVPCVVPIQPSASLPPPDLPVVELPPIVGAYVQMYNILTPSETTDPRACAPKLLLGAPLVAQMGSRGSLAHAVRRNGV